MNALEQKIFALAKENGGFLSYSDYINVCLYDQDFGYYKRNKIRVGDDGDFYTSVSLKQNLFGKLIKASAKYILQQLQDLQFRTIRMRRRNLPSTLPAVKCVEKFYLLRKAALPSRR